MVEVVLVLAALELSPSSSFYLDKSPDKVRGDDIPGRIHTFSSRSDRFDEKFFGRTSCIFYVGPVPVVEALRA